MKNPGNVLVFADTAKMISYVVEEWERMSADGLARRGYFAVALSGGTTPVPFYRALAAKEGIRGWDKTHVFLADERFVPATDPESNYRMIRETLLEAVDIPDSNLHPVPTDLPDPGPAAEKYERDLKVFFRLRKGDLPVFDLILLGLGADGHTASLFPLSDALKERKSLAVPVSPGGGKRDRVTLTLPVINSARNILFLVRGREKAKALRGVAELKDASLPASGVRPETGALTFLADAEAASLLSWEQRRMK
jgi:6-phosphogluconolactonase